MRIRIALLAVLLTLWCDAAHAFNLRISNVRLTPAGTGGEIVFDISWRDSWRGVLNQDGREVENWDAAWVFAKYVVDVKGKSVGCLGSQNLGEGLEDTIEDLDGGQVPTELVDFLNSLDTREEYVVRTVRPQRQWIVRIATSQEKKLPLVGDLMPSQVSAPGTASKSENPLTGREITIELSQEGGAECLAIFNSAKLTHSSGAWKHARIAQSGHTAPDNAIVQGTADERGVFIFRKHRTCDLVTRAQVGCRGRVDFKDVGLLWLPENKEVSFNSATVIDVWLMAVEMVYIPQSSFFLGENQCKPSPSRCFYNSDRSQKHFEIKGEDDEIQICPAVGEGLCWQNRTTPGTVPSAFPKGSHPFYIMKYELTQGQYADFLNTQNLIHRTLRFPYGGQDAYRYRIIWDRGGSQMRVSLRPERANNWVSWSDAAAFLDWAALRPITELEYEKAARGPGRPVPNEYAWGTSRIVPAFIILGSEEGDIVVSGNSHVASRSEKENYFEGGDEGFGPLPGNAFVPIRREFAGSFEPSGRASFLGSGTRLELNEREDQGMSYYGVFHLTGNLWEFTININTEVGRSFQGQHGDGELNNNGLANVKGWPAESGTGAGFRGGAWYTTPLRGRVADRAHGDAVYPFRSHDTGIRGARTVSRYKE